MAIVRWLRGLWYAQQRKTDLAILWPACVTRAPDLDTAKAAFALHALHDPAWLHLGEENVVRFIGSLGAPQ